jgi:serpin B
LKKDGKNCRSLTASESKTSFTPSRRQKSDARIRQRALVEILQRLLDGGVSPKPPTFTMNMNFSLLLSPMIFAAIPAMAQPNPVAPAINQLGIDLLRAEVYGAGHGNVLLSPYSIEVALAMAYTGADGLTKEEMQRVLHLPTDDAAVLDGFSGLAKELVDLQAVSRRRAEEAKKYGSPQEPIEINVANRLFAQNGFAFCPAFTSALRDRFAAPLEELDFAHAAEPSRITINNWVAGETHDRIRDLVPSGAIDASTRAVLANALYLRAPWTDAFKPTNTKNEPFWIDGKTQADVPTMHQRRWYGHDQRDGYAAITLPYFGGSLQFLILLPDKPDGLAALERVMTPDVIAGCTNLARRDVILHLPKFKLAPPSLPLGAALRGLGMTTAFDQPRESANFDRMAPRRPDDYLYISEVIHKTWLSLDENGTEAAAATAVMMRVGSMLRPNPPPVEIRVDHPFLFAIQHVPSGACLFLGRLEDPR